MIFQKLCYKITILQNIINYYLNIAKIASYITSETLLMITSSVTNFFFLFKTIKLQSDSNCYTILLEVIY